MCVFLIQEVELPQVTMLECKRGWVRERCKEEYEMRCSVPDCPGEYEQREVVRAMSQGDRIIVVEHIPAEVCDVCGDVLFTPETIERLEALRQTTAPPIRTVPLYRFARSA